MKDAAPSVVKLADYKAPDHLIPDVDLHFQLEDEATIVTSKLTVRKNHAGNNPLVLNGEKLQLKSVKLNGRMLSSTDYQVTDTHLTIPNLPDPATLEIVTEVNPKANTELAGLYQSNGIFTTQCEAEDFRRITYFIDRPDVMSRFKTTISADAARFPVVLGNGNLVSETVTGGRRIAVWDDPHPKPCYLFAIVAGNLEKLEDTFTTKSGRVVKLGVLVEPGNLDKTRHAMDSIKHSMKWDEDVYGREYDLDVFNVVAVNDFNAGAMENKGLNIFNAKYVLANPLTATDGDFEGIESVIAHEYFHNWSGNRVTCRDWFQLSLKEGLTVFRDQNFSADMNSAAVQRITDVTGLRRSQFAEDNGPTAHPVRPDSYMAINNFYTATVYEKGAEVVRMLHTLLGPQLYRTATDLYFTTNDGKAVTCDDFVAAMEQASGRDLTQFKRWYAQAGTPVVEADGVYDPRAKTYTLTLSQTTKPTPGQPTKLPFHIPVRMGLIGADGKDIPLQLQGEAKPGDSTRVIELTQATQTFTFVNVPSPPNASLFRGFSAPVRLVQRADDNALRFRLANDSDSFNRWEAGQILAERAIKRMYEDKLAGKPVKVDAGLISAFRSVLTDGGLDPATKSLMLVLPTGDYIAQTLRDVDPVALHSVRKQLRAEIGAALRHELLAAYAANQTSGPYQPTGPQAGMRALKNTALAYLMVDPKPADIVQAKQQYDTATNMTDRMAALAQLANADAPERTAALADFYSRFKGEALVIDKWFGVQGFADRPSVKAEVEALMQHPDFTLKNPNRLRALVGSFAGNPAAFHAADGSGYKLVADVIAKVDGLNPQVAAGLVTPFKSWRQFAPHLQAQMKAELEKLHKQPGLSKNVMEMVEKSLEPPPAGPGTNTDVNIPNTPKL